jgi:hypothetical protein
MMSAGNGAAAGDEQWRRHAADDAQPLKGDAGIKFVAHLRGLGRKSYAVEQLTCLFSRDTTVDVKTFKGASSIPSRPIWCRKMRRDNSN